MRSAISAISVRPDTAGQEELDIRLIGKVRVSYAGHPLEIGGPRQQLLLATLTLAERQPLSTEDLIVRVWDDRDILPARVYESIRDLRECFDRATGRAAELLPRDSAGYRVGFGRTVADLHRFQDRRKEAERLLRHDDDVTAVRLLHEALGEWGGRDVWEVPEPFAGLGGRWITDYRQAVLVDYRATVDACQQAELRLGLHEELIPALFGRVQVEPTDEKLVGMLMVAYYRAGRQTDAAALYRETARRLHAEGLLPSGDLQRLHELVLRQDSSLDLPSAGPLGSSVNGTGRVGEQASGQPGVDAGPAVGAATGPADDPVTGQRSGPAADRHADPTAGPVVKPTKKRKKTPPLGPIQIGGHGAVFTGGRVDRVRIGDNLQVGDVARGGDGSDQWNGGPA
jgi:DNA-binding SARP family transcriptional activator